MKPPLIRAITELQPLITEIIAEISQAAAGADAESVEDLARLHETIAKASERIGNTTARLLLRARERRAGQAQADD